MFRADELLLSLREAHIGFVVIGGIAVGVHGYVRATKDLDIIPDPEPENLTRLSSLLHELDAQHVGVGDFAAEEFPYDPTDPEQLAQGANFRLETRLGPLDIMQWAALKPRMHAHPSDLPNRVGDMAQSSHRDQAPIADADEEVAAVL